MATIAESRTLSVESTRREGIVLTNPRPDKEGNNILTLGVRSFDNNRPNRLKVVFPPYVENTDTLERGQRIEVTGDSYMVKKEIFYDDPKRGRKTTHKAVFEGESVAITEPTRPITVRRLHEFLKEK